MWHCYCPCLCVLQLTDVDPPYGKAPTAQLADKLVTDDSPAKEFLEGPKEMVLTTQVRGMWNGTAGVFTHWEIAPGCCQILCCVAVQTKVCAVD